MLALRQHSWPGRVQTHKSSQHEADFGAKWLQSQRPRAPNSALTSAPAELLLRSEYDAIFLIQQASHHAMMLSF